MPCMTLNDKEIATNNTCLHFLLHYHDDEMLHHHKYHYQIIMGQCCPQVFFNDFISQVIISRTWTVVLLLCAYLT